MIGSGGGHKRPRVPGLRKYRDQGFGGVMKMISAAQIETRMMRERPAGIPAWALRGEFRTSGYGTDVAAFEQIERNKPNRLRRLLRLPRTKEARS